jgi:hypothetical protein
MAITDPYATAAEYRAAIKKTDTAQDAVILTDLKAVSRYIEARAGRFFNKDAAAVARTIIPGYGGAILDVGDIAALTDLSVVVDQSATGSFSGLTPLDASKYQLLPLNATLGPEPKPYTQLFIPSWSTAYHWSPSAPVQVTAIWGWPAVPDAIKRACIELTGILRLETPRATRTVNVSVNEVMSTSRLAQDIISDLVLMYSPTGGLVVA